MSLLPPLIINRNHQGRRWSFTQNVKDVLELVTKMESLEKKLKENESVKYAIFQGEQESHYHLQGYIEFSRPWRFNRVKKLIGKPHAHIELARKSRRTNYTYCTKDDTRVMTHVEVGSFYPGGQGTRTDIIALHEDLDNGDDPVTISENHFPLFLRYNRGIALYRSLHPIHRIEKTKLHLYIGPPGCGKSTAARALYGDAYHKPHGVEWFDGYHGQDTVIMDDFSGSWLDLGLLLKLADEGPCWVNLKSQTLIPFASKNLVITANKGPHWWYDWDKQRSPLSALLRRVTSVTVYESIEDPYHDNPIYGHLKTYSGQSEELAGKWIEYGGI